MGVASGNPWAMAFLIVGAIVLALVVVLMRE
jgi:hypothetical protein